MEALRIIPPDFYLSVSESMPTILGFLDELRAANQIYQIDDQYADWYFSFEGRQGFGEESHLTPADMLPVFAEHGGDPDRPGKHHPLDALVWRQARPGEPSWDSDLGRGRPGWHIACAALACSTLGTDIDIQGGGADLVFPHHEMCAIQAQVATGHPFAKAYVHSAMVGLDGEKMSKSKGNLVKVPQLPQSGADPMAVRLALLSQHYQTDWEWTPQILAEANERLDLWRHAASGTTAEDFAPIAQQVRTFLRDNLHADKAVLAIDQWAYSSLEASTDFPGARDQMARTADFLLGVAVA
jgi:L-cysteine:1D-myo-inositol 2-amino-2-deoxy-alpha-D-glucopyranoside ligase